MRWCTNLLVTTYPPFPLGDRRSTGRAGLACRLPSAVCRLPPAVSYSLPLNSLHCFFWSGILHYSYHPSNEPPTSTARKLQPLLSSDRRPPRRFPCSPTPCSWHRLPFSGAIGTRAAPAGIEIWEPSTIQHCSALHNCPAPANRESSDGHFSQCHPTTATPSALAAALPGLFLTLSLASRLSFSFLSRLSLPSDTDPAPFPTTFTLQPPW